MWKHRQWSRRRGVRATEEEGRWRSGCRARTVGNALAALGGIRGEVPVDVDVGGKRNNCHEPHFQEHITGARVRRRWERRTLEATERHEGKQQQRDEEARRPPYAVAVRRIALGLHQHADRALLPIAISEALWCRAEWQCFFISRKSILPEPSMSMRRNTMRAVFASVQ